MGIVGAGFFHITKAFLLGSVSAIASFFIIFYQFEIPFTQTKASDSHVDKLDIPKLLRQLEDVSDSGNETWTHCWLEY